MFLNAEPRKTGRDGDLERGLAKRAPDHLGRHRRLVREVGLEQLLVVLGDRVDELVVVLLGLLAELLRDLAPLDA